MGSGGHWRLAFAYVLKCIFKPLGVSALDEDLDLAEEDEEEELRRKQRLQIKSDVIVPYEMANIVSPMPLQRLVAKIAQPKLKKKSRGAGRDLGTGVAPGRDQDGGRALARDLEKGGALVTGNIDLVRDQEIAGTGAGAEVERGRRRAQRKHRVAFLVDISHAKNCSRRRRRCQQTIQPKILRQCNKKSKMQMPCEPDWDLSHLKRSDQHINTLLLLVYTPATSLSPSRPTTTASLGPASI